MGALDAIPIPSFIWFLAKVYAFLFVFIWIRGTLPRFRYDQLMGFAWKRMLPLALANVGLAGIWLTAWRGFVR